MAKQPAERFSTAADVREALKTVLKALQLDSVFMPGEGATNMPAQQRLDLETPEEEKRSTGILSMIPIAKPSSRAVVGHARSYPQPIGLSKLNG